MIKEKQKQKQNKFEKWSSQLHPTLVTCLLIKLSKQKWGSCEQILLSTLPHRVLSGLLFIK